jgi:hypothetical protein
MTQRIHQQDWFPGNPTTHVLDECIEEKLGHETRTTHNVHADKTGIGGREPG